MWLPPPARYSLVGSQKNGIRKLPVFYSYFQVTSGQMSHFRVTSGHLRSRDVICCHVTASSCKLQPCRKSKARCTPVSSILQILPGDFRLNDVTSGLFRSPEVTWVISCHMTASSCKQQPRKSHARYTSVSGFPQPLPGDFRSNDVTSGSLPVTWGHVTSFPVTWLLPFASYTLVGSQTHSIRQFSAFYSHFQVTSGQMTSLPGHFRSPEVKWRHFLTWLPPPASYSLVGSQTQHTPAFGLLQPLPGDIRSNDVTGHFRAPEVTWHHFLSLDCLLLRAIAS